MALNFLTESSKGFEETETLGAFSAGSLKNSFENMYENAYNELMVNNVDPMVDINLMIKNPTMMESFKENLLSQLKDDCTELDMKSDTDRFSSLYEQTKTLFDNCLEDLITESTRVGQLLPIKAIDFPILIKQNLAIASKDIIQTEVTKSPVIKKHIERRWVVDEKTGKRWEYPQCFFKEDYKEIFNAGKGYKIPNTPVDITEGKCFNWNLAANILKEDGTPLANDIVAAGSTPEREKITFDLKIIKAIGTDGKEYAVNMRINMSDNTWLGGQIKDAETNEIIDIVTGTVDFITNTVSIGCLNGKIAKVVFDGYLSNEYNERQVTFDRTREEFEWKIEDGFRADVPYSLEELEDAKALMDLDLYKLTYSDLSDILVQMEDNKILEFLDAEYAKYKDLFDQNLELDPLGFNSFVREQVFDCDSKTQTVALQVEYIQKMLKFYIDRFIIDIMDTAKIENMTFVMYGNPRYISLLDPEVNWVVKSGDSVGGVKMNYNYGVMNAGGAKIQVVSTMKYDSKDERKLRIIPYPISDDQFTFKHYKYTTHILTAQNSVYRSPNRPGGSMTYLMGTTRNTTASIQGIQGSVSFENTPFILDPSTGKRVNG